MTTSPYRLGGCLLLGAVLALTTACRPDDRDQAAPPVASLTSSAAAGTEPVSSPPASSSSRSGTTPPASLPPTSSAPASSAPASSPAAGTIEPGGCPTAALAVEALRASGAAGHQYAFLQFTNRSATACSLTGYPGVQLVKAGAPLGQPAVRSGLPVHRVQLAPGHSVTARLVVASTCEADKSDSVAIYPPNRTERVVVPLSVRGCPMSIDPVVTG
jgi:hypothetical protein